MSSTMFRGAALKRVSSPEQLDTVVRSAMPRHWLALATMLAVVAGIIAWSSLATVPTTMTGPGYLLPQGGLQEVDAPVAGTLVTLTVKVGDHVVTGQTIGTIQPTPVAGVAPAVVDVVVAGSAGTATEVDDQPGGYIAVGALIVLVDPAAAPLTVYAYLPTAESVTLQAGTPARVTFAGGIGSAYGYAKGTVVSVSSYPVSVGRLQDVLHAASLVHRVEAQGSSDEIVVILDPSPTNPSGIAWGSGHGPPGALPRTLPADVELVVGSHRPISNVF